MPVKGQCRLTVSILFKALIVALGMLGQRISFMRAGFRLGASAKNVRRSLRSAIRASSSSWL